MIKPQKQHRGKEDEQNNHPSPLGSTQHTSFDIHFNKIAGQIHQPSRRQNLGYVIECTLPSDKLGLFFIGQFTHVHAVAGNIVSGPTEGNNGQQSNGYAEEMRKVQRKSYQPEGDSRNQLGRNNKEFLRAEQFQEGTPQRFQRPWKKN